MKEFHIISKNKEKDGPWKEEPDLVLWTDPETGYECHIKRHGQFGFWCGYVDAPSHNELEEAQKELNEAQQRYDMLQYSIKVHGGITYEGDEEEGIKRYGFDCGHCDDISPFGDRTIYEGSIYRDKEYAMNECTNLSKQLKKLEIK